MGRKKETLSTEEKARRYDELMEAFAEHVDSFYHDSFQDLVWYKDLDFEEQRAQTIADFCAGLLEDYGR